MNNVLGDALKKAIDAKKNDYSNFVWKGEKRKEGDKYVQDNEKIVDMTPERLKECWEHCERMLRNDDPKHLGRYNVLEEVIEEIGKCNVELFLRYLENKYLVREHYNPTPRFKMMVAIREFIKNSEQEAEARGISLDWKTLPITHLSEGGFPAEFQDISISDALEGCIDQLGAFNKQHLTMTFITEKGLSFHEMRAMLTLPKKQKYSDMTTEQLVTLRNKVLLRLSKEIDSHIFNWKRLQRQIELIAKNKGVNLHD